MARLSTRIKHAWNVFTGREFKNEDYSYGSTSYSAYPYRQRPLYLNDRSIVSSIYTSISIDVAQAVIKHVRLDDQDSTGANLDSIWVPTYSTLTHYNAYEQTHTVKFISIPIQFGYRFSFNKFEILLQSGLIISTPYVTKTNAITLENPLFAAYSTVSESPYKKLSFGLNMI